MLPTSPLAAIRWLPLVNQSSSTIPAFACLRVVSTALDSTGQLIYTVDQPNGDASANYLFNGPSTVAAGAGGSGTLDFPCQAIWDTATPSAGDLWGPKTGQWTLTKNGSPGFPVLGIVDNGTSRMLIGSPSSPLATIVKPVYDIAAISSATPGSGSVEVYSFNGTVLSDTASSITGYNLSTSTAKAGTYYEAVYINGCAFIVNSSAAVIFEGTIYGTVLTTTATTGEVTPTTAIWGALPDPGTYPITVQNDYGLQGPIGRKCLVALGDDGTYYLIQVQPPSDVLFEGTLDITLSTTDATATVVPTTAIYGGLPIDATISARNDFQASGSYGQLVLVAEDILGNYFLIPTASQPLPILFWTTLSANLLSGDTTIGCAAGVTQIFGTMPASSITADNTLGLCGQNGTPCLVAGDATMSGGVPAPNYYLLAVQPSCAFWATISSTLASTTATIDVTPTLQVFGTMPASGPYTANNLLKFSGKSGDTFLVVQREANGDYDLIAAKPVGGGCTFTLTSAYTAGAASATVGTPWGSAPDAAAAAITVNDLQGLFSRALTGAVGEAIYDPTEGYIVVACDQETTMYAGTLSAALAATTTSLNVQSLAACDAKPFGQATTASYYLAYNTLKLSGKSGDPCYIKWNQATGHWEITAVTNRAGGCKFTLTSAFVSGSASATAGTVWGNPPTTSGSTITVLDPGGLYGPAWASGAGAAVGQCVYDPVSGNYIAVSCQTFWRYIWGVVGSSTSTVVGGRDGVSPGSSVVLTNDASQFTMTSGKTYRAFYDPATNTYGVIWVGC
jgi:hypothetical protein